MIQHLLQEPKYWPRIPTLIESTYGLDFRLLLASERGRELVGVPPRRSFQ